MKADSTPQKFSVLPDESPVSGSDLEWWFVQGHYEGKRVGRRYFMASIFRHRVSGEDGVAEDGASLLIGVLDPVSK
ncbi:MAG: hypothetical protein KDA84_21260, partial [Planctomycetaceae bacterium]|nr:hypothetical protein [Planctomycetaceae bacterium]